MRKLSIKVWGAIVLAVVTAGSYALDISQVLNVDIRWLPLLTFIIFVGVIFWIILVLHRELQNIKTAVPRLILHRIEPTVDNVAKVVEDKLGNRTLVGVPTFTRIWIRNDPERPELGVDAENLYAKIEFYDEHRQKMLISMSGRWPEVGESHDSLKTQQVKIPPNNKPFCLDIAMKYKEDDEVYGYDDMSHLLPDGRNSQTKLGKGIYFVKVSLACKGLNLPLWFKLDNPGKCQNINFSEVKIS